MSLLKSKTFAASFRQILVLVIFACPIVFQSSTPAQQPWGRALAFPTAIQWARYRGVSRYRLQIAGDEQFRNIFYDGLVTGDRYTVNRLFAGYYYWRVAPAEFQRGEFSRPARFFVSGGLVVSRTPAVPIMRPRSMSSPISSVR